MKNIRGPKSALSDFIAENRIQTRMPSKELRESIPSLKNRRVKKQKKPRNLKVMSEFSNIEKYDEDESIRNFLNGIDISRDVHSEQQAGITDEMLFSVGRYLSRNRMMNQEYFDFLVENSKNDLAIFDCSTIKNYSKLFGKKLRKMELYYCGQLEESTLNTILGQNDHLRILKITGGYLLEDIEIGEGLESIDLSDCSRLRDKFIDRINRMKCISTLNLSSCYRLTENITLTTFVKNLFLCETKIDSNFLNRLVGKDKIETLSLSMCANIEFDQSKLGKEHCMLTDFTSLKYLDLEGISTVILPQLPDSIQHLNIAYCYNIRQIAYPNLTYLNVSYIPLKEHEIKSLVQNKKLTELNISWNHFLTDELFEFLINNLSLKKIVVFGCFSLTKKSAKKAWRIYKNVKTIGHPCETEYLLEF